MFLVTTTINTTTINNKNNTSNDSKMFLLQKKKKTLLFRNVLINLQKQWLQDLSCYILWGIIADIPAIWQCASTKNSSSCFKFIFTQNTICSNVYCCQTQKEIIIWMKILVSLKAVCYSPIWKLASRLYATMTWHFIIFSS